MLSWRRCAASRPLIQSWTPTAGHEHRLTGNRRAVRVLAESTWLARESGGFQVVHHFGGRVPARRAGTTVVIVHDLQPMEMPKNYSLLKRRYLGWSVPRSVRSAALVLTPSQWVAERVVDLIGVPEERLLPVSSTYRTGVVDTGHNWRFAARTAVSHLSGRPPIRTRTTPCSSRRSTVFASNTPILNSCSPAVQVVSMTM